MTNKGRNKGFEGLMIEYRALGTIHIDELAQAILTDLNALKDIYNLQYVKAPRLRLPITNEYGDAVDIKRPGGGVLNRIDTHHFKPACKDYEL